MLTSNNGFQTKSQKNQLLKETLKKQLADPSYWYKTTAQQQLTKIEQEEAEALWVKNNPNASLGELFYPSMRKTTPESQTIVPKAIEATNSWENTSYQNASSNRQTFSPPQNKVSAQNLAHKRQNQLNNTSNSFMDTSLTRSARATEAPTSASRRTSSKIPTRTTGQTNTQGIMQKTTPTLQQSAMASAVVSESLTKATGNQALGSFVGSLAFLGSATPEATGTQNNTRVQNLQNQQSQKVSNQQRQTSQNHAQAKAISQVYPINHAQTTVHTQAINHSQPINQVQGFVNNQANPHVLDTQKPNPTHKRKKTHLHA